ncbi:hypothetical protein [Martelella mediterranea]|nr:hypothetical protein [Martelella mediterranea]
MVGAIPRLVFSLITETTFVSETETRRLNYRSVGHKRWIARV